MERLLTPKEAAKIMAVSPRTIKEWLRRGEITGIKIRHLWRIRASDLEKFIQQGISDSQNDKESPETLQSTSREPEGGDGSFDTDPNDPLRKVEG
jgi:excisionase family DNA binding protein